MRWDHLFASLDARFDDLIAAEAAAEAADRQRLAMGSVRLQARLAGAIGQPVRLQVTAASYPIAGVLQSVGPDWLLLNGPRGQESLVRTAALASVDGVTVRTGRPVAGVAARLDFRYAVRGLVRDRAPVTLVIGSGADGAEMSGTIDRVGADFVEVARHAAWEPRRAESVASVALVPLTAIAVVRSHPLG